MNIEIETYRPGLDDAEVLDLRARVWGADHPHTTMAFLSWLFQKNPAGPGSGILLRRHGALIGFAGLSPRSAIKDGRTFKVAHGLDFMVDPAATKGLSGAYAIKVADAWAKLASADRYAFGVNFPNANSYRLLTSARLGWRRVLAPRLLVRPLPGLRLTEGLPTRIPPGLAAIGGDIAARALGLYAALARGGEKPARLVTDFDWLRGGGSDKTRGIAFLREPATLNWRYREHPAYRYRIFAHDGDTGSASGLVTSPRTLFGVESSLIVDLVGEEQPDACLALVSSAVADAKTQGASIVGALACAGGLLDRVLKRLGFIPVPERFNPKPFYMVAHPLAASTDAAFAGAEWRFAWGDTDVV
ncbi:hypothetical protein [Lichenifustis flavocetrariae]|uniref:N-acetyltransferase domain-containing protein n=1 Tax=Lichenifustis flavocetrariae TaxID=2949735 RepID=A0AA41Z1W7_9HYPH|nr:hypothetical protein [Lichenifustis flavocetrariae]MCW6511338.1 hypothetical protein [Lichenifustis flavocetrariae]